MSDLAAVPDAIRGYGNAAATMAVNVATVGAVNQAATMAAAIPVFGLIGQDFLASFAVAQANHLQSVGELAHVCAMTAVSAHEGAATYQLTDECAAAEIDITGRS
ncbi:type VII secretion target [Nocardia lijiangensis]|uniref:type VII secretion target n=1 Tax=Nocardia lijiangensis TaxID=299618 RepID=UPI003D73F6C2